MSAGGKLFFCFFAQQPAAIVWRDGKRHLPAQYSEKLYSTSMPVFPTKKKATRHQTIMWRMFVSRPEGS